jgi:hypothetical protein
MHRKKLMQKNRKLPEGSKQPAIDKFQLEHMLYLRDTVVEIT